HPNTSTRVGSYKASLCDLGHEGARARGFLKGRGGIQILKAWKILLADRGLGRARQLAGVLPSLLVQVGRQQKLWRQEIQVAVADFHLPPALQVST
uniref:Predicted gene, 26602 n=1 Tax=Mus spicilegus TaxID=10103 RepID=A0A8C6G9N1_MUSSI